MIEDPMSMDEAARFRITCSAAMLIAHGASVEQAARVAQHPRKTRPDNAFKAEKLMSGR